MKHILTAAVIGGAVLATPALASAHTADLTLGCYTRDVQAPYIEGRVDWGRFPIPNGPRLYVELVVNGNEQDVNFVPLTASGMLVMSDTRVVPGDNAATFKVKWYEGGRWQYRSLGPTINCPIEPTPPPVPEEPEVVPTPAPPPTAPPSRIEPLPPVITPNPDKPPVKRVPTTVKKQVQVVRVVACVLGPKAKRAYTVRQVKVTWSRGGKVVLTKFGKRYVVRGQLCSLPPVTG